MEVKDESGPGGDDVFSAEKACNVACKPSKDIIIDDKQRVIVHDALITIESGKQLLLFLHGPPGTGKSVVSNAIVRGLKLMGLHMWAVVEPIVI